MWKVEFDARAAKELRKLGQQDQVRVVRFLRQRLATEASPRRLGKALKGQSAPLWRYRVSDLRLICSIEDQRVVVLVVKIGRRDTVYGS